MKTETKLKQKRAETETTQLQKAVIDYILNYYSTDEEIKSFVGDLLQYGCQSGMINDLVYYSDTIKFYDTYEDDIEDLITNFMEDLGIESRPLFIESLNGSAENMTQEKNLLSWFAFEETAKSLNDELKINEDFL